MTAKHKDMLKASGASHNLDVFFSLSAVAFDLSVRSLVLANLTFMIANYFNHLAPV